MADDKFIKITTRAGEIVALFGQVKSMQSEIASMYWLDDSPNYNKSAFDEGDVRVMSNQAMIRPVTIVNRNGDIDYRVRGESSARFDCETVDGRVYQKVRYGRLKTMSPTDRDSFNGTLNDGDNPVRLRTVNGDIRVAVVYNPEQVGEFILSGP